MMKTHMCVLALAVSGVILAARIRAVDGEGTLPTSTPPEITATTSPATVPETPAKELS